VRAKGGASGERVAGSESTGSPARAREVGGDPDRRAAGGEGRDGLGRGKGFWAEEGKRAGPSCWAENDVFLLQKNKANSI